MPMSFLALLLQQLFFYGAIWVTHYYFLAKHLIAGFNGSALPLPFLHRRNRGHRAGFLYGVPDGRSLFTRLCNWEYVYILTLAVLTAFIYAASLFGFDRELYTFVFYKQDCYGFHAITAFLAAFYSYYKYLSERELILIYEDLRANYIC